MKFAFGSGNIHFVGDDGEIALNELPDYGIKDYETAQAMMKLGSDVYRNSYKSGIALVDVNIENNFEKFASESDIIIANRMAKELDDFTEKVYSRDVFLEN